ncbi:diguanylate cyclase domain-containing protein [Actinoplanes sp. NPDC000266]
MRKLLLIITAGLAVQFLLPHLPTGAGLVLGCLPIAVAGVVGWAGFRRQARRHAGRERAGYLLGSISCALLGVSYLLYTADAVGGGGTLLSGAADLASAGAAVASVPAILLGMPPLPDRLARGMYLIDVVTTSAAIFAAVWQFVLVPAGSGPSWVVIIAPEIVTAALALMLMSRTDGRDAMHLLAAGMGMFALAGVLGVRVQADHLPWYSGGLGAAYIIAGLTIAVGSWQPVAPVDPSGWRTFTSFWSTVSSAPTALLLVCVLLEYRDGRTLSPVLVAVLLGSAVLAMTRQFLSLLIVRRLRAELDHQAFHDTLTGLPNRAAFHRHTAAVSGATAVLMLDLDGFKQVNDSLGHAAGDVLLAAVGHRIAAGVRPGDVAARLGGDEFAVVMAGATEAEAAAVGARLLDRIAEPIPYRDTALHTRASIGVSVGTGLEALLHEADTALYAAKAAGKGVVRTYDSGFIDKHDHAYIRSLATSNMDNGGTECEQLLDE